jgi:hypothetical protein
MERHPADPLSLAFGILFAAFGLATILGGVDVLSFAWVGPLLVIAFGAIVILAARPSSPAFPEE